MGKKTHAVFSGISFRQKQSEKPPVSYCKTRTCAHGIVPSTSRCPLVSLHCSVTPPPFANLTSDPSPVTTPISFLATRRWLAACQDNESGYPSRHCLECLSAGNSVRSGPSKAHYRIVRCRSAIVGHRSSVSRPCLPPVTGDLHRGWGSSGLCTVESGFLWCQHACVRE